MSKKDEIEREKRNWNRT